VTDIKLHSHHGQLVSDYCCWAMAWQFKSHLGHITFKLCTRHFWCS